MPAELLEIIILYKSVDIARVRGVTESSGTTAGGGVSSPT
jgi:hypothetical protein